MTSVHLGRDDRYRIGRGIGQEATPAAFRAEIHRLAFVHLTRCSGGRIDRHPAHRVDNHLLPRRGSVMCSLNGSVHFIRPLLLPQYRLFQFSSSCSWHRSSRCKEAIGGGFNQLVRDGLSSRATTQFALTLVIDSFCPGSRHGKLCIAWLWITSMLRPLPRSMLL